jgi:hypothetical protein
MKAIVHEAPQTVLDRIKRQFMFTRSGKMRLDLRMVTQPQLRTIIKAHEARADLKAMVKDFDKAITHAEAMIMDARCQGKPTVLGKLSFAISEKFKQARPSWKGAYEALCVEVGKLPELRMAQVVSEAQANRQTVEVVAIQECNISLEEAAEYVKAGLPVDRTLRKEIETARAILETSTQDQ